MYDFRHLFVSREIADFVKDIGFNEPGMAVYNNNKGVYVTTNPKDHYYYEDSALTYDQVLNWLLETHNIYVMTTTDFVDPFVIQSCLHIKDQPHLSGYWKDFATKSEALDDAIMKAITWIRAKKQLEKKNK